MNPNPSLTIGGKRMTWENPTCLHACNFTQFLQSYFPWELTIFTSKEFFSRRGGKSHWHSLHVPCQTWSWLQLEKPSPSSREACHIYMYCMWRWWWKDWSGDTSKVKIICALMWRRHGTFIHSCRHKSFLSHQLHFLLVRDRFWHRGYSTSL